jgi:membrane-associated protease RseP (regulator of RpoE activity)
MQVAPLPPEFMAMGGEIADSLTGAYVVLLRDRAELQQQWQMREAELFAEARARNYELQESDGVLSSLAGENRRLYSQLRTLEAEMHAVRETETSAFRKGRTTVHVVEDEEQPVGGTLNRVTVRARQGLPTEVALAPRGRSRVSARLVGEHIVMGAQLMSLNPRLSEYFEADDGVLVVEVFEGTPAAEAGIVPGDVIVRAGRHAIREVEDIRRALAEGRAGLRFRVIRKGDTLTVRVGG